MVEHEYSSDSDAPEEISHAKSKANAIKEFKKVDAANASVKEKSKAKRRAEIERNIGQKKVKQQKINDKNEALTSIPDDLLLAIGSYKSRDQSLIPDSRGPKLDKIKKRKDHVIVNNLETDAAKFNVIKLDEVNQPLVDQKKEIDSI